MRSFRLALGLVLLGMTLAGLCWWQASRELQLSPAPRTEVARTTPQSSSAASLSTLAGLPSPGVSIFPPPAEAVSSAGATPPPPSRERDVEALLAEYRTASVEETRLSALSSLIQAGGPEVIGLLVREAENADLPSLRYAALRGLEILVASEGTAVALRVLQSGADSKIRSQAAVLLAKVGGKEALPVLSQAVVEDKDPLLRSACVQGLGYLSGHGYSDAQTRLEEVFSREADPRVRGAAAFYLASEIPSEPLRRALEGGEKDAGVRRLLPTLLAQNGAAWALPLLVDAVRGDPDPRFRKASLLALGTLCRKARFDSGTFQALAALPQEGWSDADRKDVSALAGSLPK